MVSHDSILIRIPWTPDLDMNRAMVANALSVRDVEAGDPRTRSILEDLLGPPRGGWALHKPFGAGGVSTCSMVARGLLERLGAALASVRAPYVPGAGLSHVRRDARALRPRPAWITPIAGMLPAPGSIVDLKPRPNARDRSNHTETIVCWKQAPDGALLYEAIAGGQVGRGGLQAIYLVSRPWIERDGRVFAGSREVDGWIDVALLPYEGLVTVPEGWDS